VLPVEFGLDVCGHVDVVDDETLEVATEVDVAPVTVDDLQTADLAIADLEAGKVTQVDAGTTAPFVLSEIPLSSQPEQLQDFKLCLALLHPGRQFHSSVRNIRLFTIIARILAGYLFCSVANCLQLIIANSGACIEGGVSSLSSDSRTSSH